MTDRLDPAGRHAIGTCTCCTPDPPDRRLTCAGESSGPLSGAEQGPKARVENTLLRAIMPKAETRRAFLRAVGGATASAALAEVFPVATAVEAFAQGARLEKKKLAVGFIPITCATPIIMAAPLGFYAKQGLDVEVVKTAGWAVVRDKTMNKENDAAHMLAA